LSFVSVASPESFSFFAAAWTLASLSFKASIVLLSWATSALDLSLGGGVGATLSLKLCESDPPKTLCSCSCSSCFFFFFFFGSFGSSFSLIIGLFFVFLPGGEAGAEAGAEAGGEAGGEPEREAGAEALVLLVM